MSNWRLQLVSDGLDDWDFITLKIFNWLSRKKLWKQKKVKEKKKKKKKKKKYIKGFV
jgi:hypothetical protein